MTIGTQEALDVILERYHDRMREQLRLLVSDEVIRDYVSDPMRARSDELRRILTYFAALPAEGGLVLERDANADWFVCKWIGPPANRVERIGGPFASQPEACVVIFKTLLVEVLGVDLEVRHE